MINDFNLFCGSTWSWTDTFDDYPASLWDCILYLKLGTGTTITLMPTKDGDNFVFSKSAAETAALANGEYSFQYLFTEIADTSNKQIESGTVPITALLSASVDPRSEDKKVYDELVAARLRVAQREYVSITINGKATQFKTLDQIDSEIIRYKKKLGLYITPRIINSFG